MGPINMNYELISSGISDFIWCHNKDSKTGIMLSNEGEILISLNAGQDWNVKQMSKENIVFFNELIKDSAADTFVVSELLKTETSPFVYFITTNQDIIFSKNCGVDLEYMSRIVDKSKYDVEKMLVNPNNSSHLLVLINQKNCLSRNKCFMTSNLYYSDDNGNFWLKIMEDVLDVIWADFDINAFGILAIINLDTHFFTENDALTMNTKLIYTDNFFIRQSK